MNRCPDCGRKTFHHGLYCGACARVIWKLELVLTIAVLAAVLLGSLFWTIDRLAAGS